MVIQFKAWGLPCKIIRFDKDPHPYYCGYVSVPEGHPFHGLTEWEQYRGLEVHGGVTYSEPHPDTTDWVFGFDCNHYCDQREPKDLDFAEREVFRLAAQLAAIVQDPDTYGKKVT